jgi:DNA modification methylase
MKQNSIPEVEIKNVKPILWQTHCCTLPFEDNTIYNDDALSFMKKMPDKSVDIIVTSPPYNLMGQYSAKSQMNQSFTDKRLDNWYEDKMCEKKYQEWQRECLTEMVRICKGSIFYVHQVRYAWGRKGEWYHPVHWLQGFTVWAEIIWNRGNGISAAKRPTMADQRIYMINKPKVWNKPNCTSVWDIPSVRGSDHVCPFPDELVERCLNMCSNENDLVFDPFMGSGTTAKVSKKMKRRFLGCEINNDYCQSATELVRTA